MSKEWQELAAKMAALEARNEELERENKQLQAALNLADVLRNRNMAQGRRA